MEFHPGYSLTGIVKDQCTMLTRFGNEVHLYVSEQFHGELFEGNYIIQKKIPFAHLKDYSSKDQLLADHKETIKRTSQIIVSELQDFDAVFTHDFIFTGWNMPYALGIQEASIAVTKPAWLHWVHSVPSGKRDWWEIKSYGNRHKIVFPNKSDSRRVAEQYRGMDDDVLVIPHIKDLRTWFDFSKETVEFINDFPGIMHSQIVQILPASVDRLSAKRVREVIILFSKLRKKGLTVCLVVANQWATRRAQKEAVDEYLIIASDYGLKPMSEVIFTSEWQSPKYDAGISKVMLRELFLCSNLFVFPTREESFGLVVPEAALSGCLLVLNKSLDQQREITADFALYMHFGSFHNNFEPPKGWDVYMDDMASIIIHRIARNEALNTKTFVRQRYNLDNLYYSYYEPAIKGSVTW
jgi:glycosyltransferase involved in cell wall biosynthesis